MNLPKFMQRYAVEHGKFERIKNPPSTHPDLCAMILLSGLMPDHRQRIINTAQSSEPTGGGLIVFQPDIHDVEMIASEAQVIDLMRCGVYYNSEYHALVMDI